MMEPRSLFALGLALASLAPRPVAHGGAYQPPPGGGGGAVGTPGASAGTPPGGLPGAPGGSSRSPGGSGASADDRSTWDWWWVFHREPFLDLKAKVHGAGASTGSEGFFLGHGQKDQASAASLRPRPAEVTELVVPALFALFERDEAPDVKTAVLMALAKIGGADRGDEIEALLRAHVAHPNQEVAETAAVALGVLGRPSSAFLLADLLLDGVSGRDLVGGKEVPWRTRAFAAYGLGVLGSETDNPDVRRFVVGRLARCLRTDTSASPEVRAACIVALGRVPLAVRGDDDDPKSPSITSGREAQVRFLLERFGDRRADDVERSQIPVALGWLLSETPELEGSELRERVARALIAPLGVGSREPALIQQGCAIGLGYLGDDDADAVDGRIRRALLAQAGNAADRLVRHYAALSLAQIMSHRGSGTVSDLRAVRAHLQRRVARGGVETARWGALALALLERGRGALGEEMSRESIAGLRERLSGARAPIDVGAFAIALALVPDEGVADLLLDKLEVVAEDAPRGQLAVALGLIGAAKARDTIRKLVESATYRPVLLQEAATGLALLGDPGAVPILIDQLEHSGSLASQAAVARALGRIGDRRALPPLVEMLSDESLTQSARAFAAVALGLVADPRPLPWNTVLSLGANPAWTPITLYDDRGLGVLNIL